MVAAEAAACGCPPLVARHTGLAEVAAGLEAGYPPHLADLAAFTSGDVADLRAKLAELLALPAADRDALRSRPARTVCERWSWAASPRACSRPVA